MPSTDVAFREHVLRLTRRERFRTADDLARRLRVLFPRVVVRASEVSGQADIWYVYRDGVWRSSADANWWDDPSTPRLRVTADGWIEEANASARAILELPPTGGLPRFFADFTAPGTLEDATDLLAVVAAGHQLAVTTLVRPTGGDVLTCDLRVWSEGDRIIGAFRIAEDVPAPPVAQRVVVAPLVCHPRSDGLFARYAAEALERLSEPTPDGLALRLRRLYPHARVEVSEGGWNVFREAAADDRTSTKWWLAGDLPSVRYDGQGRITAADPTAEALLGPGLVGRHWQELVTAGTADQVAAVLRLIAETGWAESRFRLPAPDGSFVEFDSYTEVEGDRYLTIMRPVSGSPS